MISVLSVKVAHLGMILFFVFVLQCLLILWFGFLDFIVIHTVFTYISSHMQEQQLQDLQQEKEEKP